MTIKLDSSKDDSPKATYEPAEKTPPTEKPKAATGGFKGKRASDWEIVSDGDGIEAYNGKTKETFKGSIKEFNVKLRG